MKPTSDKLVRALADIRTAEVRAEILLAKVLPVGTQVWWNFGSYTRSATVVGNANHGLRLRVRGVTGKEYWQDARWIVHCMYGRQ